MILLLLACKDKVVGELRVTEVHPLPLDTPGQWFEITQLHRDDATELGPVQVSVGGVTIDLPEVTLGPGERFVVGTNDVDTARIPVDLQADFVLDAGTTIGLRRDTEAIFSLDIGELPWAEGSSAARYPEDDDELDNWCMSWESSDGDFASPGELSGDCGCRVVFDFHFRHVTDPALDVEGTEAIYFEADGRYSVPSETGDYERSSDAEGQHLSWTYSNTGIAYSGTRPYGSEAFVDQPITIPDSVPEFASGTWTSTALCESAF